MTFAIGDAYLNALVQAVLSGAAFSGFPATMYGALWTVAPALDGTGGTEVANANNYSRITVPNDAPTWGDATAGTQDNKTTLTFPTPSGSWGTVVAFTLMTSGTYGAGNMILRATLTNPRAIASGSTPRFPIGAFDLIADNASIGIADGYREELLDAVYGAGHYSVFPTFQYAALWNVAPNLDGTGGSEVPDANGYQRVEFLNNAGNWPAAAANLKSNGNIIAWPTASASWGTVVAVTFHDDEAWGAGDLVSMVVLDTPKAIGAGVAAYVAEGELAFQVST